MSSKKLRVYKFNVKFEVRGVLEVHAENKIEAERYANNNFGAMAKYNHSASSDYPDQPGIVNYCFPLHLNKIILHG